MTSRLAKARTILRQTTRLIVRFLTWIGAVGFISVILATIWFGPTFVAWWASIEWGSASEALSALGTLAAVFLALWVARRDGKRLEEERIEAKEDRDHFRQGEQRVERRRLRLAAEQVTFELERHIDMVDVYPLPDPERYHVLNESEETIYTVTLMHREPYGGVTIMGNWPLIQGHSNRVEESTQAASLTGVPELQFNDESGVRWRRRLSGRVAVMEPEDPEYQDFMGVGPD